jgi:hypothetical protein
LIRNAFWCGLKISLGIPPAIVDAVCNFALRKI